MLTTDDIADLVRRLDAADPPRTPEEALDFLSGLDIESIRTAATVLRDDAIRARSALAHWRASAQGTVHGKTSVSDDCGATLEIGHDAGGTRAYLSGERLHAGESMWLLMQTDWMAGGFEYEWDGFGTEFRPYFYFRLPGAAESSRILLRGMERLSLTNPATKVR